MTAALTGEDRGVATGPAPQLTDLLVDLLDAVLTTFRWSRA